MGTNYSAQTPHRWPVTVSEDGTFINFGPTTVRLTTPFSADEKRQVVGYVAECLDAGSKMLRREDAELDDGDMNRVDSAWAGVRDEGLL